MQRVCFCKTVSLFNHVLQPSQAIALFYQSLIFSLKNLALIRWISSTIDIPTGLQLLMIDINGNVTVDDDLLYKHLSNAKREVEQRTDTTSILKWISRIVLRLASDCSISSKTDRSIEFESFNEFLKQFHTMTTDDRSTLSDDDEGISSDDMDEEDISRRAIIRALMKCIDYTLSCSMSNNKENQLSSSDMQDFESNSIALYNQQIIQILCSDTLELEIELARDLRQSSFEITTTTLTTTTSSAATTASLPSHDNTFYSVWAALWRDVTTEYLQFSGNHRLRKTSLDSTQISSHLHDDQRRWSMRENDRVLDEIAQRQQNLRKTVGLIERKLPDSPECLHDRLMSEIKQQRILKPIVNRSLLSNTSSLDTSRKRIRPVQTSNESDFSSDDEDERDEFGRKRVAVIECLLESSPEDISPNANPSSTCVSDCSQQTIDDDFVNLTIETLSLSTKTSTKISSKASAAFEHLPLDYISMEEILRLLKDSSNTLSLTFDEFCHIRNVITRAELETLLFDEKLYAEVAQGKLCFTCRKVHFNLLTLTFGVQCYVCKQKVCRNCITQIAVPKEQFHNIPVQSFSKTLDSSERSLSFDNKHSPLTPVMNDVFNEMISSESIQSRRSSTPTKWQTEPIDICTDCFFLLQQIRKKTRQRHVTPPTSSSRSTSNMNLSTSSSASSIAALLAHQQHQMSKSNSIQSNLKSIQDPLQTITTIGATGGTPRVTLSRRNLFLKLQPAYDVKWNHMKSE